MRRREFLNSVAAGAFVSSTVYPRTGTTQPAMHLAENVYPGIKIVSIGERAKQVLAGSALRENGEVMHLPANPDITSPDARALIDRLRAHEIQIYIVYSDDGITHLVEATRCAGSRRAMVLVYLLPGKDPMRFEGVRSHLEMNQHYYVVGENEVDVASEVEKLRGCFSALFSLDGTPSWREDFIWPAPGRLFLEGESLRDQTVDDAFAKMASRFTPLQKAIPLKWAYGVGRYGKGTGGNLLQKFSEFGGALDATFEGLSIALTLQISRVDDGSAGAKVFLLGCCGQGDRPSNPSRHDN